MKVKAAVARTRGAKLQIEALELDEPRADEILVRLIASGVAQADLDAIDGRLAMPLPFVPGCEGAGIVERVGAGVTHVDAGDSVVIAFAACGHCAHCVAGHPRACETFAALNLSGRRLDGSTIFAEAGSEVNGSFFGQSSFASHVICPASSAVAVGAGAPLELLAALGGDLMLGAGTVLHGFQPHADDALLIVGAGAIGLAALMAAKARGVTMIIVADASEALCERASELGASVAIHPEENLPDLVRSMAADGVRFALETTGLPDARQACLDSLSSGGTCAFVAPSAEGRTDFDDQLPDGSPLILSVDGHAPPSILIPELARLQAKGEFPLERIVEFFPFEHAPDAIEALRRHAVVKPVLRFQIGSFSDLDRAREAGAADDQPQGAPDPTATEKTETEKTDALVKS